MVEVSPGTRCAATDSEGRWTGPQPTSQASPQPPSPQLSSPQSFGPRSFGPQSFGPQSRLLALKQSAERERGTVRRRAVEDETEECGPGVCGHEAPDPEAHGPPEPVRPVSWHRTVLLRWARRWLPEPWLESRVDINRPGLLGLSAAAVVLLAVVGLAVWADAPSAEPAPSLPPVLAAPEAAPAPSSGAPPERVVVSVVGKVDRPGLVTVEPGARVADALGAAGGPLPGTDVTDLNLARKLADGEQLYVAVPAPPAAGEQQRGSGAAAADYGKVDLNTATKEQLDALPGVGAVTAERVLQWRATHGRFNSVDQLREVGGIGDSKLSKLRDRIRA